MDAQEVVVIRDDKFKKDIELGLPEKPISRSEALNLLTVLEIAMNGVYTPAAVKRSEQWSLQNEQKIVAMQHVLTAMLLLQPPDELKELFQHCSTVMDFKTNPTTPDARSIGLTDEDVELTSMAFHDGCMSVLGDPWNAITDWVDTTTYNLAAVVAADLQKVSKDDMASMVAKCILATKISPTTLFVNSTPEGTDTTADGIVEGVHGVVGAQVESSFERAFLQHLMRYPHVAEHQQKISDEFRRFETATINLFKAQQLFTTSWFSKIMGKIKTAIQLAALTPSRALSEVITESPGTMNAIAGKAVWPPFLNAFSSRSVAHGFRSVNLYVQLGTTNRSPALEVEFNADICSYTVTLIDHTTNPPAAERSSAVIFSHGEVISNKIARFCPPLTGEL